MSRCQEEGRFWILDYSLVSLLILFIKIRQFVLCIWGRVEWMNVDEFFKILTLEQFCSWFICGYLFADYPKVSCWFSVLWGIKNFLVCEFTRNCVVVHIFCFRSFLRTRRINVCLKLISLVCKGWSAFNVLHLYIFFQQQQKKGRGEGRVTVLCVCPENPARFRVCIPLGNASPLVFSTMESHLSTVSFFFPGLDRRGAISLLRTRGRPGSYLLRESSSVVGSFVLSFRVDPFVRNFTVTLQVCIWSREGEKCIAEFPMN